MEADALLIVTRDSTVLVLTEDTARRMENGVPVVQHAECAAVGICKPREMVRRDVQVPHTKAVAASAATLDTVLWVREAEFVVTMASGAVPGCAACLVIVVG